VPPGFAGTVDAHGNLILTLAELHHAD